jgi:hypothetical protein
MSPSRFCRSFEVLGEAQDRHDFRRDRDVEARSGAGSRWRRRRAKPRCRAARVVHVHHAPPGDAALVDFQLVAPVDVVVDHRRQQVVGRGDGVEIAGEMQVHLLHRHDLRIAAAGRAALHAEIRPERGFADADRRLLADPVQAVAQTDGGRGLALARRRRIDRGDEDQLAVGPILHRLDEVGRNLGLVMAVGQQMFGWMPSLAPISWIGFLFAARAISMSVLKTMGTVSSSRPGHISRAALATNRNRKQASCLHETGRAMRQLRHWWP